jgi:arginine-tRNA-protein transferase
MLVPMPSIPAFVDEGDCVYLPGRQRRFVVVPLAAVGPGQAGALYGVLSRQGFRRSGGVAYRPECAGCSACVALRVGVAGFRPRRDQRRCWTRNADLQLRSDGAEASLTALLADWLRAQHGRDDEAEDTRAAWLERGGVPGGLLEAVDGSGRVVAVSIVDVLDDGVASVACAWDPAEAGRGLGTWMALAEMDWCRSLGLPWWYPGYQVSGCRAMAYKARFGPAEAWDGNAWVPYGAQGSGRAGAEDPAPDAP